MGIRHHSGAAQGRHGALRQEVKYAALPARAARDECCLDVALSVSVRCLCSLPVGRATLRLLVRSHGGRGADALWGSGASRRRQSVPDDLHISQSCPGDSEQMWILQGDQAPALPPSTRRMPHVPKATVRTDCSCHPDHEMWPPGVPSLSLQQPQAMMLHPMQASTTRWGGTE